jgi:hypothetical protein
LPFATQPIDNVKDSPESGGLKSPQAFVSDLFAEERRKGREPTMGAAEKAWTAERHGQRDEVRAAAREELEKDGKRVQRGRPKKPPK